MPRLLVSITERQEIEAAIEQAEDSEDEETTEAHCQRLDALEEKEEELKERLQVPDPAQVALAGALVTIDRNDKLRIERGLLKPGDAKKAASTPRSKAKAARAASGHSAPLLRRLSAHRTLALRATLAQRADIALVAITHRLVLRTFYPFGASAGNPLKINHDVADLKSHAEDLDLSRAHEAIQRYAIRGLWWTRVDSFATKLTGTQGNSGRLLPSSVGTLGLLVDPVVSAAAIMVYQDMRAIRPLSRRTATQDQEPGARRDASSRRLREVFTALLRVLVLGRLAQHFLQRESADP